jgi:hypothetical protein
LWTRRTSAVAIPRSYHQYVADGLVLDDRSIPLKTYDRPDHNYTPDKRQDKWDVREKRKDDYHRCRPNSYAPSATLLQTRIAAHRSKSDVHAPKPVDSDNDADPDNRMLYHPSDYRQDRSKAEKYQYIRPKHRSKIANQDGACCVRHDAISNEIVSVISRYVVPST